MPRTAEFVLRPRGCIHKEELGATILYKDHHYKKYLLEMRPKEVHCVHPFLIEKAITQTEFLALSKSGYSAEIGVNFENIDAKLMSTFLMQTYRKKLYKVSEYTINNETILYLASESIGEKAYYLLTALIKEEEDLTQVMLRAVSDKPHGLNGFLNETVADLRHVVETVQSAREIGVIKKEQVINIIDSVVQRTTFAGGEGGASVNIKDSVVQRTEFNGDEERKRREKERRSEEDEKQERPNKKTERVIEHQRTISNSIGMELVLIPPGEFDMGSPADEKDRDSDEGPVHSVKISNAFYMGKYEVTQKQ